VAPLRYAAPRVERLLDALRLGLLVRLRPAVGAALRRRGGHHGNTRRPCAAARRRRCVRPGTQRHAALYRGGRQRRQRCRGRCIIERWW
jgi:hypothetical protein